MTSSIHRKLKCLRSVLRDGGRCDPEIRRRIRIENDAFENLSIKKQVMFVRKLKKNSEMLRTINIPIFEWMVHNFLTEKEI